MKEKLRKKMNIRKRLLALEVISIVGMIAIGLVAITTSNQINQASTVIADYWIPAVIAAEEWKTETSNYRIAEYNHALASDSEEMRLLYEEIQQKQALIAETMKGYGEQFVNTPEEERMYADACALWDNYLASSEKVLEISLQNRSQEALDLLEGESKEAFEEISAVLSDLAGTKQQGAEAASETGNQLYRRLIEWKIVLIIALAAVLSALVVSLIKGIADPLEKMVSGIQKIAAGNFDVHLDSQGDSEIQDMSSAVNGLAGSLEKMVADEKRMLRQIGDGNLDAVSQAENCYRGDFAAVLYGMENLKARLKKREEEETKENH